MPSKAAHVAAAQRNQATLEYLLRDDECHLPWAVAVAFYKALHMTEAMFAADPRAPAPHTDEHKTRNKLLKKTPRYAHIWRHYQPLFQASLIARYLQDENGPVYEVFSRFMNRTAVEGIVVRHYLLQIERSIGNLLGEPDFMSVRGDNDAN